MEKVKAEVRNEFTNENSFDGYVSGNCPQCGFVDAFWSQGEHSFKGKEKVRCPECGTNFLLLWEVK